MPLSLPKIKTRTIRQALRWASQLLASQRFLDACLQAEVLLGHTLGVNRTVLFARLDEELTPDEQKGFKSLVDRRLGHEPLAYIVGHREFYGRDFCVDPRVLIPRPESELLVEKALELAHPHPRPLLAEVGTGSGAIAISIALNLPQAEIYASDISPDALAVAQINCQRHGVETRVHLLLGDMLDHLPQPVDIVLANLPYVPDEEWPGLPPEVRLFEPMIALKGGPGGLGKIHRFLTQVSARLRPGGSFLLEIGAGQAPRVKEMVEKRFPSLEIIPDLAGIPRLVKVSVDGGEQ